MRVISFLLAAVVLVSAGCSTVRDMPEHIKERVNGGTYITRSFTADQRATYDAARAALGQMNFRILRGGAAQGRIVAIGALQSGDRLRDSHQLSLDVKISPAVDGTEVSALFSESFEDQFGNKPGMGETTPLHETGLYEIFFGYITDSLKKTK